MKSEQDKNASPPRRNATFSPYIPAGVMTADELLDLAQKMKDMGASQIKLGGEIHFVWPTLHRPAGVPEAAEREPNDFRADAVRPVKLCSAETFCRRFKQPVYNLALKLDRLYRNRPLPGKLMIGVAGCQRSCSEPATKDIGIRGRPDGYEIMVGGSAGMRPMLAQSIGLFPTEEDVIGTVGRIIDWYGEQNKKSQRLGRVLEKTGLDPLLRHIRK